MIYVNLFDNLFYVKEFVNLLVLVTGVTVSISNSAVSNTFIFLFCKTSRPTSGPTQPFVQRVLEFISVVRRPVCGVNHSPPSSAEFKNERSYTSAPPICLCGLYRINFTSY
jgi:hypothetical protein